MIITYDYILLTELPILDVMMICMKKHVSYIKIKYAIGKCGVRTLKHGKEVFITNSCRFQWFGC